MYDNILLIGHFDILIQSAMTAPDCMNAEYWFTPIINLFDNVLTVCAKRGA